MKLKLVYTERNKKHETIVSIYRERRIREHDIKVSIHKEDREDKKSKNFS